MTEWEEVQHAEVLSFVYTIIVLFRLCSCMLVGNIGHAAISVWTENKLGRRLQKVRGKHPLLPPKLCHHALGDTISSRAETSPGSDSVCPPICTDLSSRCMSAGTLNHQPHASELPDIHFNAILVVLEAAMLSQHTAVATAPLCLHVSWWLV